MNASMTDLSPRIRDQLAVDGYVVLKQVFQLDSIRSFADRLSTALESSQERSILRSRGRTYGSRNLLESFPEAADFLKLSSLNDFAIAVLGSESRIVRALFFDKPPDRTWSLPWHRDRTIAVARNDLPSKQVLKPTLKAGVPHVEAPTWLLENMITLRIHLDA